MKWHRLYSESEMDPDYQKLIRLIISYKNTPKGSVYEKEHMKAIKSIIRQLFTKDRINESGGRTALIHCSWRTGKWTWEDAYWRSVWKDEFDTEEEALLSAKEQGYVFANTPGTAISRPIDYLLEGKSR